MNSKISDFGLARIFQRQEFEANTEQIVGTHGYMSPEYAMNGIVSTKTDVFSFGVLVLEILSGKRNNSWYHVECPLNLIGHAWKLCKAGRVLEEITEPYADVNGGRDEMVLWIANRDDPITDTSGILMVTPDGSLMISHSREPNLDKEDLGDDELLGPFNRRRAEDIAAKVNKNVNKNCPFRARPKLQVMHFNLEDDDDDLDGAGATGLLFLHP
ncbi:G-type lectin S-receptor-like serine/threonine-protein kinase CES101 [Capsicum annuum]|uniref:G-type lectin S-receptor-like serine/threonine-protein kinase CES101 n=1 Tax=Capsicum annuum TaxID=4072 RepID=UPI001FB12C77|nr:G-type lectin S-receptor-like serine/threonine-protein kinase CES101 [Capsicum annuum]